MYDRRRVEFICADAHKVDIVVVVSTCNRLEARFDVSLKHIDCKFPVFIKIGKQHGHVHMLVKSWIGTKLTVE